MPHYVMSNIVSGIIQITRPVEWTKSFANMLFAVALVFYVEEIAFNPVLFIYGFIGVALLWGGLYTLNDWSDYKVDLKHPVKKIRAIPSGKISPKQAFVLGILLIAIAFVIGATINTLYVLALAGMTINQYLYSHKPFNLKKRPVVDLVSGSLVNPLFRFYAGWFLFSTSTNIPLLALVYILGLQYGGYTFYRLFSKKHEEKLNYNSSIVVFGEKTVKLTAYLGIFLGLVAFILMLTGFNYNLIPKDWGFLPLHYGLLFLTTIFFIPSYLKGFTNPDGIDLSLIYKKFYLNYALFVIGFFLIFLLYP